ncbi:uncharacterized protein Tes [Euwallacea similis]|uniref:uncharacterized protein Tes n=1 Tax=Euwallacea similis TaxID=1736056 RepID=UPI00344D98E9
MSGEIEVSETPNWLNDLEAKRERRLKVKLGHETGAGAPCLKCGDDCPGLDLHFWRKACKICRCPKEEHDVPDDDIYGWAQFQLLGSKPNRVKTKIILPGRKDEVELEWAPKGHKETIDKYLKTLPPEALPVKGSQAAQDRKQLLQKQIPVHDIDPGLCHELNDEEVARMEEYVDHIKSSSVGVGQIVNLSTVIKANLHSISPQEAHIIASKHPKSIPFSEVVNLQSGLAKSLDSLSLNQKPNHQLLASPLPTMQPSAINPREDVSRSPYQAMKFKDINHVGYSLNLSPDKSSLHPRYADNLSKKEGDGYSIDEKLLQGTNFNPALTPSQFMKGRDEFRRSPVPYADASFEKNTLNSKGSADNDEQTGFENPLFKNRSPANKSLPGYSAASNVSSQVENLDPTKPLKSMKDLIYSTYDPNQGPIPEDISGNVGNRAVLPGYEPHLVLNTYKHDPSVIALQKHSEQVPPFSGAFAKNLTCNPANTGKPLSMHQNVSEQQNNSFEDHGTAINNSSLRPFNQSAQSKEQEPNINEAYNTPSLHDQIFNAQQRREQEPHSGESGTLPQNMYNKPIPSTSAQFGGLPLKARKPLANQNPRELHITEDFLEPHFVNIGSIQDLNPDIRKATSAVNPGYQDEDYGTDYSPESIKEILNNIKLPDCHYCKKPFEENEFAVTIDRASVLFHANCFRCAGCNQCLADNIYFYHKETNNVYCGRDYAKIRGYPRCSACDELIFTKEYCLAENNTFHLKHFCCFQCDTPLAGQDYTLEKDKPYCLPCYETSKAAKCSTCEKVIKPHERGCHLNGVHFHAEDECFRCIVCGVPLMGKKLLLKVGKLYCSHDCFNSVSGHRS